MPDFAVLVSKLSLFERCPMRSASVVRSGACLLVVLMLAVPGCMSDLPTGVWNEPMANVIAIPASGCPQPSMNQVAGGPLSATTPPRVPIVVRANYTPPGFGNPQLFITWNTIVTGSDWERMHCNLQIGGDPAQIAPIPYYPPDWWDNLPPMQAPIGVNAAKWAKLGLKMQFQIWSLAKALGEVIPGGTGLSVNAGPFASADIDAMYASVRIQTEAASIANKALEAGESLATAQFPSIAADEARRGAVLYLACEMMDWLRSQSSPLLSQDASHWVRNLAQGYAEGSEYFPKLSDQFAATRFGLLGLSLYNDPRNCDVKAFENIKIEAFRFDDTDLFANIGGSGGGGGGNPPPPPQCEGYVVSGICYPFNDQ